MRIFLKTLLALGAIMMMGAFFLVVDQFATDERKEAFNTQVDSMTDAMAETPERAPNCRRRCGGFWHSIQPLANGVFRSSPVAMADIMPPAPVGWERREYTPADRDALVSDPSQRSFLSSNAGNRMLRAFEKAAAGKSMSSAMTYQSCERVVMIRLQSKLDNFRKADAGTNAEKRKMLSMKRFPANARLFMTVDGHPIGVLPQFLTIQNGYVPTEYRRFAFSMGRIVQGEVIARASDADLVDILGKIDFAGVQAVLDEPTDRFVLGKGVEWAGEMQPSADLPPHTLPYRAHLVLTAEGGADRSDAGTLKVIAKGNVTNWDEMTKLLKARHNVSPEVIELLGEEPTLLAAAREANHLLLVEGHRLDETHTLALQAVATRRIATQGAFREQDYWQADWDPKATEVFAMLPE